jgi:hypothetical protein
MSRPAGLTMMLIRWNHTPRRVLRFYLRNSHAHSGITRLPAGVTSKWKINAGRRRAPCTTHYGTMVPMRKVKKADKSRHLRWLRWWRMDTMTIRLNKPEWMR